MRIRRRASDPPPQEAPAPVDVAPAGRPVAAFAGVLDGRRLWVALDAQPGAIALRDTTSGDVVAPPDDAADDQPGYLASRLDLADLPPAPATYDVVLVPPGNAQPRPVWTPPLPAHLPPPTGDGRTRHRLARGDDGTLLLRSEQLADAVDLVGVSAGRDALTLRLAGTGVSLDLVGEDDALLASWPVEPDGDGGSVVAVALDALDDVEAKVARFRLDGVPVRRRANDLGDPDRGAPLPQLFDAESERVRLRLRWSGHALLQARVSPAAPPVATPEEMSR